MPASEPPPLSTRLDSGEREFVDLEVRSDDLGPGTVEPLSWNGLVFDGCRFVGLPLGTARLHDCRFQDCEFVDCDLSGADLPHVEMAEVRFVDTKALGVDWSSVVASPLAPHPVRFERCLLSSCTFGRLDLRRWEFHECTLADAGFDDSDLRECRIHGCDLSGATFTGCDLRGVDLTGSHQYAFDLRANRVSGLKVSPREGAALLRPFGIELA